jgi:drug/metabolite transporter (DMT)-like permease
VLTVVLALGTSVCYGMANFFGPQLSKRDSLVTVLVVSQVAALLACLVYLAIAGGPFLDGEPLLIALLAGLGNAGGLIGFYKAAELGPISVVAPIGATAVSIPVFWGLSQGEGITVLQTLGLALAGAGCVLAARRPPTPDESHVDPRGSIIWAFGSMIFFGTFLTALPEAAAHGRAWTLVDARLALLVCVAIWAGPKLRTVRLSSETKWQTTPGLLLVAGTLLYAAAASRDNLSLVSPLSSLFPVVIVILGIVVLNERPSRIQSVGVATALAGVILLAT